MKCLLVLFAAFALTASAADVDGSWKAAIETPNGTIETTFTFKADGDKLTGKVSNQMGDTEIQDGKISGSDVSFVVVRNFQGNEFKLSYKGKVSGNEMKLSIEFPGRDPIQLTAKKVS
ncbi:MAG TPA: hypothetical protein VMH81_11680 [Bryobacteraceae bacterium]|nr:hypothetical protein [Bryobacteraceae bacterium]